MPAKTLEKSLKDLETRIGDLTGRLGRVESQQAARGFEELKGMLRRRVRAGDYSLFKKYSFRLFLREVLNSGSPFRLPDVVRYSSPKQAEGTFRLLSGSGL